VILKDWLKREDIQTYHFCNAIGISSPSIYKSINGTHTLSSRSALKIEAVTDGAVPREHAMFPMDYVDIGPNGETQYRMTARIHKHLAQGVILKRRGDSPEYSEKEFFKWAYGEAKPQAPIAHCHKWAEKHPELTRIDYMSIEDGFAYMKSEYEKFLKKKK
jgi:DNA-binding transcriptional regulator YdaS (Cro superfamily)